MINELLKTESSWEKIASSNKPVVIYGTGNGADAVFDRFYTDLEFGTAGLRGVIGAGTNRMNIYTVRKATQGLANYILKQGGAEKGVAIAYDSRNMSPEFADEAAGGKHVDISLSPKPFNTALPSGRFFLSP